MSQKEIVEPQLETHHIGDFSSIMDLEISGQIENSFFRIFAVGKDEWTVETERPVRMHAVHFVAAAAEPPTGQKHSPYPAAVSFIPAGTFCPGS